MDPLLLGLPQQSPIWQQKRCWGNSSTLRIPFIPPVTECLELGCGTDGCLLLALRNKTQSSTSPGLSSASDEAEEWQGGKGGTR